MDGAEDTGTTVAVAMTRARALLSSRSIEDRVSGWKVIGELCDGHPQNVQDAWALSRPLVAGEQDSEVLPVALWALGVMHTHEALDAVLAHTESIATAVRLAVAQRIPSCAGDPPDERAVQALGRLTTDDDNDVRDWATFGLGTQLCVDTAAIRDVLADRLDDPHDDTRAEAIVGLAQRGDGRALPAVLAELAADCVGRLTVEAAMLLADDRLLAPLIDLRDWWDDDPALRENAIRRSDPVRRAADDATAARLVAAVQHAFPAAMRPSRLLRTAVEPSFLDHEPGLVIEWAEAKGQHHWGRRWGLDGLLTDRSGGDPVRAARNALDDIAAANHHTSG